MKKPKIRVFQKSDNGVCKYIYNSPDVNKAGYHFYDIRSILYILRIIFMFEKDSNGNYTNYN